jgi:hypothetical protein
MAYVVGRAGRRWEIRESVHTPAGPRARTLATFETLDDAAVERARRAATRPLDRNQVRAAARRVGAPVAEAAVDGAARRLLAELSAGRAPGPALRRLLVNRLAAAGPMPELPGGDGIADWAGASAAERAAALHDLLALADRLPAPRRGPLQYPRLASAHSTDG